MLRFAGLIGVLIAASSVCSSAAAESPEPTLQFLSNGTLVDAPVLSADIDVHVSGLIARATVRQSFRNDSPDWVEAVYRFPLPDDAAVDRLRIRVGERVIEGEIQEREKAKQAYSNAKAAGKKASLVQQSRANLFTTRIANIAPGETVQVEIEYQELIDFAVDTFRLRVPLTMTERYAPRNPTAVGRVGATHTPMVEQSQGHRVSLDLFIDAGVTLDVISSAYHTVTIDRQGERYHVSLVDPDTQLDQDFELTWRPSGSDVPRAMSFSEMRDGEPYYVVMLMPPTAETSPLRMPREAIFIIDTSGSMQGESIAQARQALLRALDALQPGDLFNVIEFNSATRPLFSTSEPADSFRLHQAKQFVSRLSANGGTEMAPALAFALNSPISDAHLRQVVFVTDGSVTNEESLFQQIERTLGESRLFTVGIGSAPNSWFMRKAAELGRGAYTVISATQEVADKMDQLLAKIESPQLSDVAIDWPSTAEVEMYPSVIPDLYRGEPLLMRVRAQRPFNAPVRVSGNLPGGRWETEIAVDAALNDFGVGALWARAKIESLLDEERRGASPDEIRRRIVETALTHRIVSRDTSLVAVDKTPVRMPGENLQERMVPSLRPKGQSIGFPATASHAALLRWVAYLFFAAAAIAFVWQRRAYALAHP